jgi:hypothetical protein
LSDRFSQSPWRENVNDFRSAMMIDLSFANSFVTHHCVLILGWLIVLALTFVVMGGDGRTPIAGSVDKRGADRNKS